MTPPYPDEVVLVNTFRRLKRGLPTGYGEIHFTVEVVDHCGKSIEVVVDERAIVDEDAPAVIGTIGQFPGNATLTGSWRTRARFARRNPVASSESMASGPSTTSQANLFRRRPSSELSTQPALLPRRLACHPFPRDLSLQDPAGIRKTLSGWGQGAPRQAGSPCVRRLRSTAWQQLLSAVTRNGIGIRT